MQSNSGLHLEEDDRFVAIKPNLSFHVKLAVLNIFTNVLKAKRKGKIQLMPLHRSSSKVDYIFVLSFCCKMNKFSLND